MNISNAEHYLWGDDCAGWHLLKTDALSVIQEKMPPATKEVYHYHESAEQVFYVLSGVATFLVDGAEIIAKSRDSLHIAPKTPHCIMNNSDADLDFLVISSPKAHGDRVPVD
ncbi:MAG: cupin domain-containing protein [Chitinophagaceae bacterium]|nr:cupin domain-containing protein [Chitinophagaceae bacterium]